MDETKLQQFSREYLSGELREEDALEDPYLQFLKWLDDAVNAGVPDPTAMALATAGKQGKPSVRIVLLKEARENGLVFFSNYESRKGKELLQNPKASVVFFWPGLERQLRIEGTISKLPDSESDEYYNSRPLKSRIATLISRQSSVISGRDELQVDFNDAKLLLDIARISRPPYWGGYFLKPDSYEFWQGREHRLNDRLEYYQDGGSWKIRRLAP